MEQAGGCQIHHARNACEYRPPKLSHYSVDGYCRDPHCLQISRMLLPWLHMPAFQRRENDGRSDSGRTL